jgi:exonuclease III
MLSGIVHAKTERDATLYTPDEKETCIHSYPLSGECRYCNPKTMQDEVDAMAADTTRRMTPEPQIYTVWTHDTESAGTTPYRYTAFDNAAEAEDLAKMIKGFVTAEPIIADYRQADK